MKRSSLHAKKPKSARAAWRSGRVQFAVFRLAFNGDDEPLYYAIARWHRAASRQRIKR